MGTSSVILTLSHVVVVCGVFSSCEVRPAFIVLFSFEFVMGVLFALKETLYILYT